MHVNSNYLMWHIAAYDYLICTKMIRHPKPDHFAKTRLMFHIRVYEYIFRPRSCHGTLVSMHMLLLQIGIAKVLQYSCAEQELELLFKNKEEPDALKLNIHNINGFNLEIINFEKKIQFEAVSNFHFAQRTST